MNNSLLFKTLQESSIFHGERNDCTVKALAIAGGLTYGVAHTMLAKRGRKFCKGAYTRDVISALTELGKTIEYVTEHASFKNIKTIKSLKMLNLKACYLITTAQHILTMKDGVIHDWTNERLHRIKEIYRVL